MWSSTFLDADGKPSFNTLQNYGSAGAPLYFFIFDLLILKGQDVLDKIAGTPVARGNGGENSKPQKRVGVNSIKIVPADSVK